MEDRLTQCLNEIIYSDNCSSELRQILNAVIELSDEAYAGDTNDFDAWIASDDFSDTVYELFGVDLEA